MFCFSLTEFADGAKICVNLKNLKDTAKIKNIRRLSFRKGIGPKFKLVLLIFGVSVS